MAFAVAARVKVNDDHSEFRNKLGTVESVSGDNHQVRLDGFPVGKTFLLTTAQLRSTTQPCPVTYA